MNQKWKDINQKGDSKMDKQELTPEQFTAIKQFASDLTTCFLNYQNTHHDSFSDIVLNYAIQVIDIHLSLAELKTDRHLRNMEKAVSK